LLKNMKHLMLQHVGTNKYRVLQNRHRGPQSSTYFQLELKRILNGNSYSMAKITAKMADCVNILTRFFLKSTSWLCVNETNLFGDLKDKEF